MPSAEKVLTLCSKDLISSEAKYHKLCYRNENFLINSHLTKNQDKVIFKVMLNMLLSLWKVTDSPLENQTT